MESTNMRDNSDVQEIHDGMIVDMRIELLLQRIYARNMKEPDFDLLYNEVVEEFIGTPPGGARLSPSYLARSNMIQGLDYLSLFQLDFYVIYSGSPEWPGFDFLPDATCAISLRIDGEDEHTSYAPGVSLGHAAIAALIQYTRETSSVIYNQGTLPLIN